MKPLEFKMRKSELKTNAYKLFNTIRALSDLADEMEDDFSDNHLEEFIDILADTQNICVETIRKAGELRFIEKYDMEDENGDF